MRPCPRSEVRKLATALGVGDATAAVLVRRGYGDPDSARAFLAAEPPGHDPFRLGDVEAACGLIRETIASGGRLCVHGDYDADGICATALAVTALRELGADVRVAPSEPVRRGVRGLAGHAGPPGGGRVRARSHRRLRHHRNRGDRRGTQIGLGGDRHRSPSTGRDLAGVPRRSDEAVGLRLPRALRDGGGAQAPRGARR